MEQPSPSQWKKQVKKIGRIGNAGKGKLRTFLPERLQKLGSKKSKPVKPSKNDTAPSTEPNPAKDSLPSSEEPQRPVSSHSDGLSVGPARSGTTRDTHSSATSCQTPEFTSLAVKPPDESPERHAPHPKTGSWPLTAKDNKNDQDPAKKEALEAKKNLFVSQTSDKADPIEDHIDHRAEHPDATKFARRADGHKQSSSTVAMSNAEVMENLKKRYSPAVMDLLLAANMQRMRPAALKESAQFVRMWEKELLPELTRILDQHAVGPYSINVRRGKEPGHRIIDVMTEKNADENVDHLLESKRDAIFPKELSSRTHFEIRRGKRGHCTSDTISRASSQRSVSQENPMNGRRYSFPVMGDSAGSTSPGTSGSATLGPIIKIAGSLYRLLNWHMFDDEREGSNRKWSEEKPPNLNVVHPSPDDLWKYTPHEQHVHIGNTVAYSGPMYITSRPSGSLRYFKSPGNEETAEPAQVVTDWALCEVKTGDTPNKVRNVMLEGRSDSFSLEITGTAVPQRPGMLVYSTGRSSGQSVGQVCEALGLSKLDNGTVTRDYAIESTEYLDANWNLCGMGILGDSGAGVIDLATNKLLGQLWGRNIYEDNPEKPPVAYFTTMSDIFDDIQERFPWTGKYRCPRPTLAGEESSLSVRADGPSKEALDSIKEDTEGAGSLFSPTPNGHLAHSPSRRSRAPTTIVSNADGVLVSRQWAFFPHAKTWPLALS